MTNIKAVDVSEIEKLNKIRLHEPIPESLFQTREVPYVKLADVLELLDRSPSVSSALGTREELDRFLRDMRDGKVNTQASKKLSKGRAILKSIKEHAQPTIPEGYALVPTEPTEEMEQTGNEVADKLAVRINAEVYMHDMDTAKEVYKAMLSANQGSDKDE